MANNGDINASVTNRQKINAGIKTTLLKGASAYEIYLADGGTLTEEEWLASLHGTDGHTPQITSEKVGTREHKLYADRVEFASIYDGFDGADGRDGQNGQDGHSPEISATRSGKTVSIKADGTEIATLSDGNDGAQGATGPSGADGRTPSITANKSGKVTTILADGTAIAEINDGADGATGPQGPKGDPGESFEIHICSSYEYDPITRIPTIIDPSADTLYLVPSESGTSPDLFKEWMYVSNNWEIFGSATIDVSTKADKVANAVSGNFAGLDNNGNLVDSGHKHSDYLTEHQNISGKADKVQNATNGNFASLDSNGNLVDSGHKHSDYLTQHQDISGKADKVQNATSGNFASLDSNGNLTDSGHSPTEYGNALSTLNQDINNLSNTVDGKYTKPSGGIPASDLASGVIPDVSGFYTKPSGGIPSSDLSSGVQTSLGKADTAYQKPSGGIPLTDLASNVQNISGTTPTITGVSGMRYICGEVSTLSITPPASGDMEVIFESGSTATVLTVPNTVKFPAWFDPTDLESDCTYDIIITNGTLGVVALWT